MLRRAQHTWSTIQTEWRIRYSCLVRHFLRPPAGLYHSQNRLYRWRLLRPTLGSFVRSNRGFQQRAREELFPLITVTSPVFPQRQFAVHQRLRFDVPGADLSQVDLVPICSDEGRVVRP